MSVCASINVQCQRKNHQKISAIQLVNTLILNKWRVIDNGKITYLPLGDDDNFDWQCDVITLEELTDIISSKEKSGEIIGLLLLWDTTDIGVHLLIHSELELTFSISVNRKINNSIGHEGLTDVNWYLDKIIIPLKNSGYIIETFSFEEYC